MQIGIVYPQTEYPPDPGAVRDFAFAARDLGFRHILAYDHVLGANPDRPGGWSGPYTYRDPFHEPLVLFAWLAALLDDMEFVTGVIVLPQRQTALVAKQAATLDWLSNGRLRLGVGIGWNAAEYEGMGADFATRGRRSEEQAELLHRLWRDELVRFAGDFHTIPDLGINPLPARRTIPLWFGGHAPAVMRRIARWGDGWLPNFRTAAEAQPLLDLLDRALEEHGRTRAAIGIEPRLLYADGRADSWAPIVEGWRTAGATHITLNTMRAGLQGANAHIDAMRRFAAWACAAP